jgi:hypothetical protein
MEKWFMESHLLVFFPKTLPTQYFTNMAIGELMADYAR